MNMGSAFGYAAWRFTMWSAGLGSYVEIDALVDDGVINPGMTAEQAREAMQRSGHQVGAPGGPK